MSDSENGVGSAVESESIISSVSVCQSRDGNLDLRMSGSFIKYSPFVTIAAVLDINGLTGVADKYLHKYILHMTSRGRVQSSA